MVIANISFPGALAIRVTSGVADHLRNTSRSLVKYIISTDFGPLVTSAQDVSDAVASFVSPSGSLVTVLRETHGESDEKKRFVEVWKEANLQAIADVTKMHGSFYTDSKRRIAIYSRDKISDTGI